MTSQQGNNRRPWWLGIIAATIVTLAFTPAGGGLGQRFLSSLRIDKPQRVSVTLPTTPGASGNRQLQDMVGGMMSDKIDVALDEKDQPVLTAAAAGRAAGFAAHLPGRHDAPRLTVLGAREISAKVSTAQLRTIFQEAGRPAAGVPATVDGAVIAVKTPRAIRAEYGHCPAPLNTIQGQIQGPPPAAPENSDCVILTESPAASAQVPPDLDAAQLVEMALELTGMSPSQTRTFQQTLDWQSTLAVSLPRFLRSYDTTHVGAAPAMLLITAGRRGPTYQLVWTNGGLVYSLAGYGSSRDAIPLATSVAP